MHGLFCPCSWEPGAIWNGRLHQLRCQWFTYLPTYYHRNQPNVGRIIIYGWYRNCLRHFQRNHSRWGFLLKILTIQLRSTNHHRKGSFFFVGSPPPAFTQTSRIVLVHLYEMEVGIDCGLMVGWLDWCGPMCCGLKLRCFWMVDQPTQGPTDWTFEFCSPWNYTLPKFNSEFTPEKLQTPNRKVVFQPPLFRGNVKLRGCNFLFEIGDGSRKSYENEEIRTFCLQFWDTFITQFVNTIEDGQILNCRSPFITQVTMS